MRQNSRTIAIWIVVSWDIYHPYCATYSFCGGQVVCPSTIIIVSGRLLFNGYSMVKNLIVISFITFVVTFWWRNNLVSGMPISDFVRNQPVQTETSKESFSVTVNAKNYHIKPQFEYDIYGLVVSYRHHDGNYGLHRLWSDHFNVADLCVVWSDVAFSKNISKLEFWNGQFTCNVKTNSSKVWAEFNMSQFSNNHLISEVSYIREKIKKINIGDQIRIQGWLSSYKGDIGSERGTSTVRTDSGNGACETIYVENIEILRTYSSPWRKLMYFSLMVFIISIWYLAKSPYKLSR